MKITDISSVVNNHASDGEHDSAGEEEPRRRKRTLLQKFNIPIEHVDFKYVETCNDAREVKRILRILRSGEEGQYPDLQRFVEERLEKLNPNSRLFRVEMPALRTKELKGVEQETINAGLAEWISDLAEQKDQLDSVKNPSDIFDFEENTHESFPLPVRGSTAQVAAELNNTQFTANKPASKNRIKSWEYDKWDQFDVDAELTKLDITDMQREEWEKVEKPKLVEEQKKVEKLMKPQMDENESPKQKCPVQNVTPHRKANSDRSKPKNGKTNMPKSINKNADEPSYIEEVNENDDDEEKGTSVTTNISSRFRKTKIVIDDLNLGM